MTRRGKNKKIWDFGEQVGNSSESQEAGPQEVILEDIGGLWLGSLSGWLETMKLSVLGKEVGLGVLGGVTDSTINTCSSSGEESGLHGLLEKGPETHRLLL